jgi:hypothetical protein
MTQLITDNGLTTWRALPPDVRKRLRRDRFATVEQVPALAAWAEARWRRAGLLLTTLLFMAVTMACLNVILANSRHRSLVGALDTIMLPVVAASLILQTVNRRRSNDLAAVLIEGVHAIMTAQPNAPARPIVVHRRLPVLASLVKLAVVAAGVGTLLAVAANGASIAILAVPIGLSLLTTDSRAIFRRIRYGRVGADLDHDGIRLTPTGARLPWRQFSDPNVDIDPRGRFAIELPILSPAASGPRKLVLHVDAIREQPLDLLLTLRRSISEAVQVHA